MKRQRGNVVFAPTVVLDTIRIDVRTKSLGEVLVAVMAAVDKLQRGWVVNAIALEVEHAVAPSTVTKPKQLRS